METGKRNERERELYRSRFLSRRTIFIQNNDHTMFFKLRPNVAVNLYDLRGLGPRKRTISPLKRRKNYFFLGTENWNLQKARSKDHFHIKSIKSSQTKDYFKFKNWTRIPNGKNGISSNLTRSIEIFVARTTFIQSRFATCLEGILFIVGNSHKFSCHCENCLWRWRSKDHFHIKSIYNSYLPLSEFVFSQISLFTLNQFSNFIEGPIFFVRNFFLSSVSKLPPRTTFLWQKILYS